MASIKTKFSLNQQVSVIKSGKSGSVTAIVVDAKGTHVDVQMPAARRPWRYNEADLQTVAEAAKAMKAHAKAAKPVAVKVEAPAAVVAAVTKVKVKAKAAKLKATAKVVKAKTKPKAKAKKVTI